MHHINVNKFLVKLEMSIFKEGRWIDSGCFYRTKKAMTF